MAKIWNCARVFDNYVRRVSAREYACFYLARVSSGCLQIADYARSMEAMAEEEGRALWSNIITLVISRVAFSSPSVPHRRRGKK